MSDEQVVRAWLAAAGRDPRSLRLAAPELRITLPDGSSSRGRWRCALLAARIGLRSRGTLRMRIVDLATLAPGRVRVRTHNTARVRARALDLDMTIDFTVRDGRIAEMVESAGDMAAWRAFWRP